MQEVTIRIQFTQPCLGYAKQFLGPGRGVIYRMPRDGVGRVMFLASWWRQHFQFAAKVCNRHHREAALISWSPAVTGTLGQWRRVFPAKKPGKRPRYALHEAYRPGTEVTVHAVLPAGLSLEEFTTLLAIVGSYRGISPFQATADTYGTFEVVSVAPSNRVTKKENDG